MVLSSGGILLSDTSVDIDILTESRLANRRADFNRVNVLAIHRPIAVDVAEKNAHRNLGARERTAVCIPHVVQCDDDLLSIRDPGQVHRHRIPVNSWSSGDRADASSDAGAAH